MENRTQSILSLNFMLRAKVEQERKKLLEATLANVKSVEAQMRSQLLQSLANHLLSNEDNLFHNAVLATARVLSKIKILVQNVANRLSMVSSAPLS